VQAQLRRGPREGWLTVLLLAVVVWSVVHSVEEAAWVEHLDLLVPLAMAGLLIGLAATKSGLKPGVAHAVGLLLGLEALVLAFGNRMTATTWQQPRQRHVRHRHGDAGLAARVRE
jgi:thiol:disulfide interchange protein